MSKSTVAKNAAAIAELWTQILELKVNFEKSLETLESKLDTLLSTENLCVSTENDTPPEIKQHDVLITGDSIVSSVDMDMIDPDADITTECIRGGRPADITNRFEEIIKEKNFKRIFVHVGTNLIPRFSPNYVADQILICLERIKFLSPRHQKWHSQQFYQNLALLFYPESTWLTNESPVLEKTVQVVTNSPLCAIVKTFPTNLVLWIHHYLSQTNFNGWKACFQPRFEFFHWQ